MGVLLMGVWLLKLHFLISILCALVIFGLFFLKLRAIVKNGWAKRDYKKRNRIQGAFLLLKAIALLLFLSVVPIVNVSTPFTILKMSKTKKN